MNSAWNVVYGHVVLCQDDPEAIGEVTKKLYGDLCSQLHLSSLLPCLVDLCRSLCGIMQSYKFIYNWHLKQESGENQEYVLKKLSNGFPRIWQDVQTKVIFYHFIMYHNSEALCRYITEPIVLIWFIGLK